MPSYLYVLRSSTTGSCQIGSTNDLESRIAERNTTSGEGTRAPGPWECIYVEVCDDLESARQRERFLKSEEGVVEKIRILYTPVAMRKDDEVGPA